MMEKRSGFVALVKKKCPDIIVTHCVLHRHTLATKTLPKKLGDVMAIVVATANFICARALNHRLFQVFCEDIGAAYTHLLYHTEVRLLSRGQVLNRVLQLVRKLKFFCVRKVKTWRTTSVTLSSSRGLRTSATFLATLTLSTFHFKGAALRLSNQQNESIRLEKS